MLHNKLKCSKISILDIIQPDVQFVYADLKNVLWSINDQSMINQNRRRKKMHFMVLYTVMTTGLILLTNSTYIFDRWVYYSRSNITNGTGDQYSYKENQAAITDGSILLPIG